MKADELTEIVITKVQTLWTRTLDLKYEEDLIRQPEQADRQFPFVLAQEVSGRLPLPSPCVYRERVPSPTPGFGQSKLKNKMSKAETWISGRWSDLKPSETDDASMSSEPVPRRRFVPFSVCQPCLLLPCACHSELHWKLSKCYWKPSNYGSVACARSRRFFVLTVILHMAALKASAVPLINSHLSIEKTASRHV